MLLDMAGYKTYVLTVKLKDKDGINFLSKCRLHISKIILFFGLFLLGQNLVVSHMFSYDQNTQHTLEITQTVKTSVQPDSDVHSHKCDSLCSTCSAKYQAVNIVAKFNIESLTPAPSNYNESYLSGYTYNPKRPPKG